MAPLSHASRQNALLWLQEGSSLREVSRRLHVSHNTISKLREKAQRTGSVRNLPRGHRPRATSTRQDRKLHRASLADPCAPAKELIERTGLASKISVRVAQSRLTEMGLRASRASKKPAVSAKNRVARLRFARLHRAEGLDFWSQVVFTDESKFNRLGRPPAIPGTEITY